MKIKFGHYELLKIAYGEKCLSLSNVFFIWFNRFKDSCELVKENARSRSPSSLTTNQSTEEVCDLVCSHCRLTIKMSDEGNLSFHAVQSIFNLRFENESCQRNSFKNCCQSSRNTLPKLDFE